MKKKSIVTLLVILVVVSLVPLVIGEVVEPILKPNEPYDTFDKWCVGIGIELEAILVVWMLKVICPPLIEPLEDWLRRFYWWYYS